MLVISFLVVAPQKVSSQEEETDGKEAEPGHDSARNHHFLLSVVDAGE
jgi:hypothetical protein